MEERGRVVSAESKRKEKGKNFGKGTAGRKEKTYLYDAIARVLKSEIRVLKF